MKNSLSGIGFAAMVADMGGLLTPNAYGCAAPYSRQPVKPRPPTKQEIERKAKQRAQKAARKHNRKCRA